MTFLIVSILLFVYPLVLYPLLLRFLPSPRRPEPESPADPPPVALVICALNEEKVIGEKLTNSLSLDYPALSVYLVNDGSTDRTAAIAREFVPRGLNLIDNPRRRGKVTNLNEVVPTLTEPIVVLSDANVIYDSAAIGHLVARFDDPTVGCVSGRVELHGTTDALQAGEASYYGIEWFLQNKSSELYSMAGVDGAMHAFRRPLFTRYPPDTLIEDFLLGIGIVRQGYRVVYEPRAWAVESGPQTTREEFRRKVRIAAGAAQALIRGNVWPHPSPPLFWFIFLSHKLLRWMSPLFGAAALIAAGLAWPSLLARLTLGGAAAIALLATVRWTTGISGKLFDAPFYFLFGQIAVGWGLIKGTLGRQSVLWTKANR